jgi:riboflavin kinase/FMN adenylyltransferase
VRNALKGTGDVEMAARFLGRPYQLSGTVVHGARRGRKIGFPTANIQPSHPSKIIPASGVYAVDIEARGTVWRGMLNIGSKPTFESGRTVTLEAHLFGFDGDLYGYPVTVKFLKRIREERKFESVEALVAQLELDRIQAQSVRSQFLE